MTRDDVIDVLTTVAACDRRTVGEADVAVWMEIIGDLPKGLAVKAVINHFRDRPDTWLQPGHVRAGVRAIRKGQFEELLETQRAVYEGVCDRKALDPIRELAEQKAIPDLDAPPRRPPSGNPRARRCPWCRAGIGDPCADSAGTHLRHYHPVRTTNCAVCDALGAPGTPAAQEIRHVYVCTDHVAAMGRHLTVTAVVDEARSA